VRCNTGEENISLKVRRKFSSLSRVKCQPGYIKIRRHCVEKVSAVASAVTSPLKSQITCVSLLCDFLF
jgi:hypothetical protein